MNIRAGNQN